MFRSKIRIHTCQVILLTSLVWFLVDVMVLMLYSDCIGGSGWGCSDNKQQQALQSEEPSQLHPKAQIREPQALKDHNNKRQYPQSQLHLWRPAKVVKESKGSPGEMGAAVHIAPENEAKQQELFKLNQFNLMASDMISLNRSLKDIRLEGCKNKKFAKYLPDTSIVIVFHNEAWTTLLRTVWSVINRSPKSLLKEIILVDDASERDHLKQDLEDYIATLPVPTYVYRTEKRSGLIRARLLGAKHVKGQVITFLDAHCECTEGWLEPLLSRIAKDRHTVVCPIIDVISDDTFEYIPASDMTWGGFNWKLNFRWYRVAQREMDRRNSDRTAPLRTPTMAGGLFSIDKEYFYELGAYDEGMDIWGGENLEMSFRIWMCGGTLEIATCSHVGHVFRKSTPYTFPGGTSKIVNHNNARLAEVWLDQWKYFYYNINPGGTNTGVSRTKKEEKRESISMYLFLCTGCFAMAHALEDLCMFLYQLFLFTALGAHCLYQIPVNIYLKHHCYYILSTL